MMKGKDRAGPRGLRRKDNEERTDPICSVCMSEEFYEDEQGGMICVACGTQSQDFLAEGFDEDDLAVYGGGTGNIVSQRNEARGPKLAGDQVSKPSKVDLVSDTLEALKLYQYVLQMIFDSCLAAYGVIQDKPDIARPVDGSGYLDTCRATLKALWMDYLTAWKSGGKDNNAVSSSSSSVLTRYDSKGPRCSIGMAFTRSSAYKCTCRGVGISTGSHPLLPSKQLLLALVYLALRVLRMDVLIADLLRWVESGAIPFINLCEAIPPRWQESVSVDISWFYDHPVSEKRPLVTYEGLFFSVCSLAQTLRPSMDVGRCALPPLNAPLVARRIIRYIGLPESVWDLYCELTQLSTAATPLFGAGMDDLHYEERIMATIIIAVKLTPRWTEWTLLRHATSRDAGTADQAIVSHSAGSDPLSLDGGVSAMPRALLPQALAQLRRTHRSFATMGPTKRREFVLNSAVFAALGGDAGALRPATDSTAAVTPHLLRTAPRHPYTGTKGGGRDGRGGGPALDFGANVSYASDYCLPCVALCANSPVTEELSLRDRRRWHYLNGIEPLTTVKASKTGGTGQSATTGTAAYMAYKRCDGDATSLHHPAYLLMLERCARYLYVNPQLLHDLVCQLEVQIVNLAFTGDSTGQSAGAVNDKHKKPKKTSRGALKSSERVVVATESGTQVVDATAVKLGDIRRTGKNRSAHLREVDEYRAECDRTLPKLRREGLASLAQKQREQRRWQGATEVSASEHESGAEGSAESDGDGDGDREEDMRVYEKSSAAVASRVQHGANKGIVPSFHINKTGEYLDIEESFGTAAEARHHAELAKQQRRKRVRARRDRRPEEEASNKEVTMVDNEEQRNEQRLAEAAGDSGEDSVQSLSDSDAQSEWDTPDARNILAATRLVSNKSTPASKLATKSKAAAGRLFDDVPGSVAAPGTPLPIPVTSAAVKPIALRDLILASSSTTTTAAAPATGTSTGVTGFSALQAAIAGARLPGQVGNGTTGFSALQQAIAGGRPPGQVSDGVSGFSALQSAIAGTRPPGQAGDFSDSSDDDARRPVVTPAATKRKVAFGPSGSPSSTAAEGRSARPVVAQKRPRPSASASAPARR